MLNFHLFLRSGNTTGRRWRCHIEKWAEGKGLAIDVAVTGPLAPTYVRMVALCEWYAATQKHGKYDLSFAGTNYLFSAMVFETLGAINTEGEELLQMLFRFASKRLGREFTSYCGRMGIMQLATIRFASNPHQNRWM